MVRITEELLRKKAEHNDGALATLRELALHQQGIEKIELLNQACRHLTALHLQNNIIAKIENLHRLKASQVKTSLPCCLVPPRPAANPSLKPTLAPPLSPPVPGTAPPKPRNEQHLCHRGPGKVRAFA